MANTTFNYYASCSGYKSSSIGTAVNDLDAPLLMNASGSLGNVWTRVLHYHYNCNQNYQNCGDEEQFYLAHGYGLWQWKHYKQRSLAKGALMNDRETSTAIETLPCSESYQK